MRKRKEDLRIFFYTKDNEVWYKTKAHALSKKLIESCAEVIELWPDGYGRPLIESGKTKNKDDMLLIHLKLEQ